MINGDRTRDSRGTVLLGLGDRINDGATTRAPVSPFELSFCYSSDVSLISGQWLSFTVTTSDSDRTQSRVRFCPIALDSP
jgi:hypothetical protein